MSALGKPLHAIWLGRVAYVDAWRMQEAVATRVRDGGAERLLLLEHDPVYTIGRRGTTDHLLVGPDVLRAAGASVYRVDRGGDITYHGPGQAVGYPILDLRDWKRDVGAYLRAVEQVMIEALADFGIAAGRLPGCTGVWVDGRKIGAIGVHISRWITSHGFALNVNTDLSYFGYIVPCGLSRPVTSMAQQGVDAALPHVNARLATRFGRVFDREILEPALEKAS